MNLKELKLKYTNRSMMIFEAITDKVFQLENMTDQYIFFYSTLLANNPDLQITFDEFIEELDNDAEAFPHFTDWFTKEMTMRSQMIREKKSQITMS